MDFVSEDQIQIQSSYKKIFWRLWPYLKKQQGRFFIAILAVFIMTALNRLGPFLIGYLIDTGFTKKDASVFILIGFAFLGVEITQSLLNFFQLYLFQKLGNRCLYDIREDLMNHVQRLPLSFFNKTPTGRTVTRMTNDVLNLGEFFTQSVIVLFTQAIAVVGIITALSIISWKLTLISLLLTPIFVWLSLILNDRIRQTLRDSKKKLSVVNSFLSENINGIKVVQLYNRTQKNQNLYNKLSNEYLDINMRSVKNYALMHPIMNLMNAVTISLGLYFGGWLNAANALTVGAVVTFIMNLQDLIHPLRDILERLQQFQNSVTSSERVFHLMDEVKENLTGSPILNRILGDIEIKNLNFRYEDHLPWVLQNINLNIKAGQSIALVGRTGSGKTTLITLLQKFYLPPEGTIFLDQKDILTYLTTDLRKRIGVVQQDPFIFRGSVLDNIRLADATISEEMVIQACEYIGYLNLLNYSGRNLQSFIEERGGNLSFGEKQLIAFARILVFDPDLLILDEATANVDSITEDLIQKATQAVMKNRTSIVIAHRLSTIQDCDQIVVLKDGQISEQGSHPELILRKGLYYQMSVSKSFSLLS